VRRLQPRKGEVGSSGGLVVSPDRARQLRSEATDAERLLWRELREFKRHGFHFRRQGPIGPYVADFVCHSVKLIIELDGGQHNDATNREHDAKRTAFLESRGYRVVRIWNVELFADPGSIANYILAIAKERYPRPIS
jgi:very-short-patch-repair endonuclease